MLHLFCLAFASLSSFATVHCIDWHKAKYCGLKRDSNEPIRHAFLRFEFKHKLCTRKIPNYFSQNILRLHNNILVTLSEVDNIKTYLS